jgi:hypothetical protein
MAEIRDKREIGYFFLENSLIDRDDLEPMERLIYMVLARHANVRGECFPSRDRLLKVTGLKDKRTITKYINKLIEKGFLEMTKRKGKSNLYFLKNIPNKPQNVPTSDVPSIDETPDTINVPTLDAVGTNDVTTPGTFDVPTGSDMKCTPKETKFKETKIRNDSQSDIDKSSGEFINQLMRQGIKFSSTEMSRIINWCSDLKLNPMKSYRNSLYLRGEKELKPTKRMFLNRSTWEKIAMGDYDDKDFIKKSNSKIIEFKPTEYTDCGNIGGILDEIL